METCRVLKLPIWAVAALSRHGLHTSDFCLCKLQFGGFPYSCADISIIWVQNVTLGWEDCSWLVMACSPFYSCSRKPLFIMYSLFSKPCVRESWVFCVGLLLYIYVVFAHGVCHACIGSSFFLKLSSIPLGEYTSFCLTVDGWLNTFLFLITTNNLMYVSLYILCGYMFSCF